MIAKGNKAITSLRTRMLKLKDMSTTEQPKYYRFSFNGVKLDPYRILQVYGITHPAQQHAIKKLLRAGESVKLLVQDIDEVILSLNRWKEMLGEEIKSEDQNTKAAQADAGADRPRAGKAKSQVQSNRRRRRSVRLRPGLGEETPQESAATANAS